MKLNHKIILITTFFSFILSTNLSAAEITFKVPLQYSNLHPDVGEIKIYCEIEGLRPARGGDSGGRVSKIIKPSTMAYNKTVEIKYVLPAGLLKSQMQKSAVCGLQFKKKGESNFSGPTRNCERAPPYAQWSCAPSNAPYNIEVYAYELHTL